MRYLERTNRTPSSVQSAINIWVVYIQHKKFPDQTELWSYFHEWSDPHLAKIESEMRKILKAEDAARRAQGLGQ